MLPALILTAVWLLAFGLCIHLALSASRLTTPFQDIQSKAWGRLRRDPRQSIWLPCGLVFLSGGVVFQMLRTGAPFDGGMIAVVVFFGVMVVAQVWWLLVARADRERRAATKARAAMHDRFSQ